MANRKIVTKKVMDEPCLTCPFEGKFPVPKNSDERKSVFEDAVNLKGQHLCHTSKDEKICRGGRNLLLKVLFEKGWIEEPNDEAFTKKSKELLGTDYEKSFSNRMCNIK